MRRRQGGKIIKIKKRRKKHKRRRGRGET